MTIHAFTDGASRGNPGDSGIGVILKNEKGSVLTSVFGYIGHATNNIAEYTALIACLRLAQTKDCRNLVVHSDSELLVRQMEGRYKVKEPRLKKFVEEAHAIIGSARFECRFRHITREYNKEADRLANLGIDSKKPIHI
jgi:Ribonuclease HI